MQKITSQNILEYYWRPHFIGEPHGRLVEDPWIIVGDPNIFIGDPPQIFVGPPIFSLETPFFHWRPNIFIGDPTFSLNLQYFHWRHKILDGDPHVFIGDPIFRWRPFDSHWRPPDSHWRKYGVSIENVVGLQWKGSPIVLQWWRFLPRLLYFRGQKVNLGVVKIWRFFSSYSSDIALYFLVRYKCLGNLI